MSFFLLLKINAILKNVENQTVVHSDFHSIFFSYYQIHEDQQLFGYPHSSKYHLCVQHKKEINTGLGQHVSVNGRN